MKKYLFLLSFMLLYSNIFAIQYDLNEDDSIVGVSSPTFKYTIGISSITEPSTPMAGNGYIYMKGGGTKRCILKMRMV